MLRRDGALTPSLYGLELVRLSNGKLKRGTIYVVLGRLEKRGLLKSKVARSTNHPGIPRPVYTITDAGERMLKAWQEVSGK